MKIKTLQVDGIGPAIHAMRNPMDSWDRSDTKQGSVGEKDRQLSEKLAKAGPEHAKHLRMIQVWAEIEAPRYWWTEFDTYRAGVEKLSCSTMHRLMARPLTIDDFEHDSLNEDYAKIMLESINNSMEVYRFTNDPEKKKEVWRGIIQALPQSYIQRRTVMMSYAALRNIIKQRKGHKLKEWAQLTNWARTLPESWMLFEGDEYDLS